LGQARVAEGTENISTSQKPLGSVSNFFDDLKFILKNAPLNLSFLLLYHYNQLTVLQSFLFLAFWRQEEWYLS